MRVVTRFILIAVLALAGSRATAFAASQEPPRPGRSPDIGNLPPAEVVRLLDAYVVMRAQDMLGLTDEQYPVFVQRFKQLQDLRRKQLQAHARGISELQRASRPDAATADDALRQALTAFRDREAQARLELEKALAAVDAVLDVRQQVRFRVFEEQMERRKLELMARARQGTARPVQR